MKSEKSQGLPPEEERRVQIALFRYALIASLLNRPLERGEIGSHLKALAAQTHRIPYSKRTTLDDETLWRLSLAGLVCTRHGRPMSAGDRRPMSASHRRAVCATRSRPISATDRRAMWTSHRRPMSATDSRAIGATRRRVGRATWLADW